MHVIQTTEQLSNIYFFVINLEIFPPKNLVL